MINVENMDYPCLIMTMEAARNQNGILEYPHPLPKDPSDLGGELLDPTFPNFF